MILTDKYKCCPISIQIFEKLLLFTALAGLFILFGCAHDLNQPERVKSGGLSSPGNYRSIAFADLNNDGRLDVVGGSSSPGTVAIWYGNGRGGVSKPQFLPFRGDVRSLAVTDVDKDGLPDIICSVQKEATGIIVWLNRADQGWASGPGPTDTGNYEGVIAVDINRDGHPDIVAANTTSVVQGGIQVWLGDGKGTWRTESGPTVKGLYMDVASADFDGDGTLDLAGAGWGVSGALKIWFGDGTGGWSAPSVLNKAS